MAEEKAKIDDKPKATFEGLGIAIPGEQIPQTIQDEAYKAGWRPKEEFSGEEAEYVDPLTFLLRGVELQKTSSKAAKELRKTNEELQKTIGNLKVFYENTYKAEIQKKDAQILELQTERDEAIKEGNLALVKDLDKKIDAAEKSKPAPPVSTTGASTADTELLNEFYGKNPWYNADAELRKYADSIGDDLAGKVPMKKILERIEKGVKDMYPEKFPAPRKTETGSPVETGGRRPGGDRGTKKYTERDLTDEQKAIGKQFVRHGAMTMDKYIEDLAAQGSIGSNT